CPGQSVTLGGVAFTAKGLVGVGRIPAAQRDTTGETFGSLSGLALDRATWRRSADGAAYAGTLHSLSDRGRVKNGVTTNYRPRIHQLSVAFTPAPAGSSTQTQLRLSLTETRLLSETDGTPLTGFEGLSLSLDGRTIYALLQSALRQDGGEDGNSQRRHTRLLAYDIANPAAPVLTGEWILPLPVYTQSGSQQVASVGDMVAINGRQFLVLVRDGNGRGGDTPVSLYRAVLVYDVTGATNLAGSAFDNPNNPAAPRGVLASSIVPASSAVLINLNDAAQLSRFGLNNGPSDNANTLSEKWESLALVPALGAAAKGVECAAAQQFQRGEKPEAPAHPGPEAL
ncbi:MAG: hypothetical protein EBR23_15690, partial [Planctomycetia bacterium]|nr:hypothetical protein [Planctomycetia bacterium]